jgi:hypothetical protein
MGAEFTGGTVNEHRREVALPLKTVATLLLEKGLRTPLPATRRANLPRAMFMRNFRASLICLRAAGSSGANLVSWVLMAAGRCANIDRVVT